MKNKKIKNKKSGNISLIVIGSLTGILLFSLFVGFCMWGIPVYKVWQQGLSGQAELARAEQNRQIFIKEAQAKRDSAKFLNEAEVIRAEGVAKANEIISEGLGGPQGYLRYLWIQSLEGNEADIIYVPTEAGLPILEAGKSVKKLNNQ